MATGILGIDCAQLVGNTGVLDCVFDPKNIRGCILVPRSTAWTPTNVTTIQTVLAAGIANNTPTARFFPIKYFTEIEDKGEDAVETQGSFGDKYFVRSGKYCYRFTYTNGGLDLHNQLSLFNGQQDRYSVVFVDVVNNCLWGTASGNSNFKGFTLSVLYAPNFKINTGGEVTKYQIEIGLQNEAEMNVSPRLIKMPANLPILETFSGLKATRLEVVTELVASTKTVVLRVWSGQQNLYDTYTTELATTALFDAYKNSTGIQNTTATVTADPANKAFTVVLTSAVTAGDAFTIKLGTVSDLTSAGLTGYANCETNTIAT